MPYIDPEWREEVDLEIKELVWQLNCLTDREGERAYLGILNYTITMLILKTIPKKKYWMIAGVTGVLQNIITEFYRRYVVDYEIEKTETNGDLPWNG
jgi:hypothetical protein